MILTTRAVIDHVGLHERHQVVHGRVHALSNRGVSQVTPVEESMGAGLTVLVKIRLELEIFLL